MRLKDYFHEVRPNMLWDAIKFGPAALVAIGALLWRQSRVLSPTVLILGAISTVLLVACIVMVIVLCRAHRRVSQTVNVSAPPLDQIFAKDSLEVKLEDALLSPDELALERATVSGGIPGLSLSLRNSGLEALENCALILERLDTYSPDHNEFCNDDFNQVVLIRPQRIAPRKSTDGCWLARMQHIQRLKIILAEGQTTAGIVESGGNWWRAQLLVKAGPKVRREFVFFRWEAGKVPEFTSDPRRNRSSESPTRESR